MLLNTNRFHGRSSLKPVYRHGKTARSHQIALKYLSNQKRKSWRAAVVVSRKVSKSAVKRNRIRRRIYEIIRQNVKTDKPVDMIFTVFSDQLVEIPHLELEKIIINLLAEAGVVNVTLNDRNQRDIVDKEE